MQLVSSPLVTAGVALVDAGVVAVTPMAAQPPGLPDVQTRAVQLMSGSDPLTEWGTVLQTAEADATDIYDHWSAAPFADLQQSIANDVGYVEDLLKNPSDISRVLTDLQNNASALFGSSTDLDLSGVAVGPIASMVELDQSIAEALGWSGVGDPLSGLADLGSSTADAGSVATDLSTVWTSLF